MPTSYSGKLGGTGCSTAQLKVVNLAVLTDGTTSTATVCVNMPVLTLNKSSCTTNRIPVNGQLSYTLSYANTGSAAATNTVLKDTIPAGTAVADAGGGVVSSSRVADRPPSRGRSARWRRRARGRRRSPSASTRPTPAASS
ncbi:MAG: hypothetical protein ABR571_03780 [Jatrophihabitans sp.]|uniref:hypothetical protein n=1 Tax=Jatrophihabitans sp. TaxID=1932789 RepID=UPI0039154D52